MQTILAGDMNYQLVHKLIFLGQLLVFIIQPTCGRATPGRLSNANFFHNTLFVQIKAATQETSTTAAAATDADTLELILVTKNKSELLAAFFNLLL